jgi:hypothetical protein
VLDRLLVEEAAGGAEAGGGEDRADPAELRERPRRQRLDLNPLGDVALDRDRRARPSASAAGSSSVSRRRAANARRYRSARRAVAAPMPLLAPVIRSRAYLALCCGSGRPARIFKRP